GKSGMTTPAETPAEPSAAEEPAKAKAAEPPKSPDAKPKASVSTTAFVGDYSGEDLAVYHIENLPDRTERDPKARMKVTSSGDSALAFEIVDSEICTLSGSLSEGGATIAKGQKCFEQNAEDASTSATVQSGTASVDQSRLV